MDEKKTKKDLRAWATQPVTAAVLLATAAVVFLGQVAFAKRYSSVDEALTRAFPGAEAVERTTVFLSRELKDTIERKARAKLAGRILTIYVGRRGDRTLGYALIDTHRVRTKTETVLIAVSPAGSVERIEVLAFHEPSEYRPTERWLATFTTKGLGQPLRAGADVPNITGATITSNAVAAAVRKALAIVDTVCRDGVCKGE